MTLAAKDVTATDWSIRNSVFHRLENASALVTTSQFQDGDVVPGVINNHFIDGRFLGTHGTTGEITWEIQEGEMIRPSADSVLTGRVEALLVPADLTGASITLPGSIGSVQVTATGDDPGPALLTIGGD